MKDDDLSIVTLKGVGSYEDRRQLQDYLDLLLRNETLLLVIDLTQVEFIPASILGVLTRKGDEFKQRQGRIVFVVDPSKSFSPLVSVDHLNKFFATAATVSEASRTIRTQEVEQESIHALIRRAKPTPPILPELNDKEKTNGREEEKTNGTADL